MNARALAAAAAGLIASACQVMDGRELRLEPAGTLTADNTLELTVRGDPERVIIDVDGERLPGAETWPTGEKLVIDVSRLAERTHPMRVRAATGGAPLWVDTALQIDHRFLEVTVVEPAPGPLLSAAPFTAMFRFSTEVDSASAEVTRGAGPADAAVTTLAPDRRSLTVALAQPLTAYRTVQVALMLADLRGARLQQAWTWSAPPLEVALSVNGQQAPPWTARTAIDVAVWPIPGDPRPDTFGLYADEVLVATLEGEAPLPSGWTVTWDSTVFAEGVHHLSAREPGWIDALGLDVVVDRTPPVPSWVTRPTKAADCAEVLLSEEVFALAPALVVGGAAWPTSWSQPDGSGSLRYRLCPQGGPIPVPSHVVVDLGPEARDRAGNLVVPGALSYDLTPWTAPWGDPVSSVLVAGRVAISDPSAGNPDVLWVPPAGTPLRLDFVGLGGGTASLPPPPRQDAAAPVTAVAMSGSLLAWTEAGTVPRVAWAVGTGTDYWPQSGVLAEGSGEPSLAVGLPGGFGARTVFAFSIPDGAGRTVAARAWSATSGWDFETSPVLAPGHVAAAPSVGGGNGAFVAWLETAPGGLPRLAGAELDAPTGAWQPLPSVTGVDPTAPAGEPVAWGAGSARLLAWVEDGRVWARRWDGAAFGAAEAVSGPGAAARSPRVITGGAGDPVVVWLQAAGSLERVRWAWLEAGVWTVAPAPLDPEPGGAATLVAAGTGAVGWIDGEGHVRIRQWNR